MKCDTRKGAGKLRKVINDEKEEGKGREGMGIAARSRMGIETKKIYAIKKKARWGRNADGE